MPLRSKKPAADTPRPALISLRRDSAASVDVPSLFGFLLDILLLDMTISSMKVYAPERLNKAAARRCFEIDGD